MFTSGSFIALPNVPEIFFFRYFPLIYADLVLNKNHISCFIFILLSKEAYVILFVKEMLAIF